VPYFAGPVADERDALLTFLAVPRAALRAAVFVPDFPYARYAELVGLVGIRVGKPEEVGRAWEAALGAGRPAVLDVYTDADVPPLRPHISLEQAKAFAKSMFHGDSDTRGMLRASIKEIVDGVLPGRSRDNR